MGLLVAFLSVTNIALGYGLAVYLRRASVQATSLLPVTPRKENTPVATQSIGVGKTSTSAVKEEVAPAVTPAAIIEEVAQVPPPEELPVIAEVAAPAEDPEVEIIAEKEPDTEGVGVVEAKDTKPEVDEENVLAGIKAFRAQLANLKDEAEATVEETADSATS